MKHIGIEKSRLAFEEGRIVFEGSPLCSEIMMDWETPLMKRHAEVVCQNGGDILEMGFGMGISAGFIQDLNPKSHTIVECHPKILENLKSWAADKPSVTIVEGRWYHCLDRLKKYDGIFFDTHADPEMEHFRDCSIRLAKPGGIISFWNNIPNPENFHGFEKNVRYEKIAVSPEKNGYFNSKIYYLPIVEV